MEFWTFALVALVVAAVVAAVFLTRKKRNDNGEPAAVQGYAPPAPAPAGEPPAPALQQAAPMDTELDWARWATQIVPALATAMGWSQDEARAQLKAHGMVVDKYGSHPRRA